MRARSICSLTPAVYLDYRNINRPEWVSVAAITMSIRPQRLTAVCQTDRETRLDAFIFTSLSGKTKQMNQEKMQLFCIVGEIALGIFIWDFLNRPTNFFEFGKAWQGVAGWTGC